MKRTLLLVVGTLLVTPQCSGEGCGCRVQVEGPRAEAVVQTRGDSVPIPAEKMDYVGSWHARETFLAIRADGTLVYFRAGALGPVAVESSIQEFRGDGFTVGSGGVGTVFQVGAPPHQSGNDWKMTLDGVELVRVPNYGEQAADQLDVDSGPKDESSAAELLVKACDTYDLRSCALLGMLYEEGVGIARDVPRAVTLFKTACDGAYMMSCAHLGGLYAEGKGVELDPINARRLMTKACDVEDSLGCFNLAVLYDNGMGVPADDTKAAGLYQRSCNRGKAEACQNLALMYETAEGVPKDLRAAARLYARACEGGLQASCGQLESIQP